MVLVKGVAEKGLSHLAQNKNKNAEMQNCMVAFFFFSNFYPLAVSIYGFGVKKTVSASKYDSPSVSSIIPCSGRSTKTDLSNAIQNPLFYTFV